MSRSISDLTSPRVSEQIRRNPVAVLPFGSVEQHGPHLPNGTDTIAAEVVAEAVAEELDALLVSVGPYGITPIHAGHPGTISLSRPTFEALLRDICSELIDMGINRLVFVNWHEGNIASIDGVATDIQKAHPDVYVITSHACYVAQRIYRSHGGELTHGGGIEVMSVMARNPALVHVEMAGDSTRPDHAIAMDEMRRSAETHGYITDVTEIDSGGWYGDPTWATAELARDFASTVAVEISKQVQAILALRETRS